MYIAYRKHCGEKAITQKAFEVPRDLFPGNHFQSLKENFFPNEQPYLYLEDSIQSWHVRAVRNHSKGNFRTVAPL